MFVIKKKSVFNWASEWYDSLGREPKLSDWREVLE